MNWTIKKTVVAVTIALILAVSGLAYTFMTDQTNRKDAENLNAEIQSLNSELLSSENELDRLNTSLIQLLRELSDLEASTISIDRSIVNMEGNISSIQAEFVAIQDNISIIQTEITGFQANASSPITIQASILDLQSEVANLEARVNALETERSIIIRVNFLAFIPDNSPPGGEDYLLDVEVEGSEIYSQARTGHSRFIKPRYLDLVIRNGMPFMGAQVTVRIYAYWHLDDMVIDIDPNPAHGRTIGTNPEGGYLTLTYVIGDVIQDSVDGNDDTYLADQYDAYFQYKVETLVQ